MGTRVTAIIYSFFVVQEKKGVGIGATQSSRIMLRLGGKGNPKIEDRIVVIFHGPKL